MTWPSPAFAYAATGEFMFANGAAALSLPGRPEWLDRALSGDASLPDEWSRINLSSTPDNVMIFMQRRTGHQDNWFDRAVIHNLQLPSYLESVALFAMMGLTNPDISKKIGKASSITAKYIERILEHIGAGNRTEFVYRATRQLFVERDLWPLHLRRLLCRAVAADQRDQDSLPWSGSRARPG